VSDQPGRYYGRYAAKLQEFRSQAAHHRAEQRLKCFNPAVHANDIFHCESQVVDKSEDDTTASPLDSALAIMRVTAASAVAETKFAGKIAAIEPQSRAAQAIYGLRTLSNEKIALVIQEFFD